VYLRPDVSDTVRGVVIAISLVPLLADTTQGYDKMRKAGIDGDKISIEFISSYSSKSTHLEVVDDPGRTRLCRLSGKSCPLTSSLEMRPRPRAIGSMHD